MKTEILEKIEILFWENSFAEVSMDEIAKTLNFKKASLYYYFPSKEQMFLDIINYSFLRYKSFLEELLKLSSIENILLWIISYPLEQKNLFSVISQKWYCKIWVIRDVVVLKNKELFGILNKYFQEKYEFNQEKVILLQSLLNDLSKKYCIFDCKEILDSQKLVSEILKIFFNK